jgi:hypothetical protein
VHTRQVARRYGARVLHDELVRRRARMRDGCVAGEVDDEVPQALEGAHRYGALKLGVEVESVDGLEFVLEGSEVLLDESSEPDDSPVLSNP